MTTVANDHKGVTLIELLIAMAVSGIVIAGIYAAYDSQQKAYVTQQQIVHMQQNMRAAMYLMGREIRMAGYDPYRSSGAGITAATGNGLTFTFVADDDLNDNDSDGTIDEPGELRTIGYVPYDAYADGDTDIGRRVGGQTRALAENIEEIEFYYTLADGAQTIAPADPSDIRSVEITILARTAFPDRGFRDVSAYNAPSGAVWGPFNDAFRRSLLTTTIRCRNMGL